MPLLLTGRGFRQELERAGALALYAPLEGGAETRLLRDAAPASVRVQMDGGVAPDTAPACRNHGCDLIVAASAIFGRGDYAAAIRALR